MRLAELADRGHVDRVVELAVPAFGEPMHDAAAGGELDRGGAVVGGVVIAVAEPGDVAGVADEHPAMIGPTPNRSVSDVARCADGVADPFVRRLELAVEAADVVEELDGQVVADLLDRRRRGEWSRGSRSTSEALISLAIPPAASSANRACMRHTSRVRWLPMSMFRLASSRSTSLGGVRSIV